MQKKVLAAVIGGLLVAPAAFADSANVTISGRIQAGVENWKVSGEALSGALVAAGVAQESGMRVSDQSSRIIFSGSEDLGGGLRALFQLDSRFSTDTASLSGGPFAGASLWGTGNTHLGLGGGFGSIKWGRQDLQYLDFLPIELYRAGSLQNYQQAGPMAQVNGSASMIATRTPNVIFWDSPNWGGLTARVAYSTNAGPFPSEHPNCASTDNLCGGAPNEGSEGVQNGPDGDAIHANLRWTSGPLVLGASLWTRDPEGGENAITFANTEQESTRVFAGYTFPFGLKVGVAMDQSEIKTLGVVAGPAIGGRATRKRDAFMVPVTFTAGVHNFYATYAVMDDEENNGVSQTDTGAKSMVIGWDMALSKRTQLGAYYTKLDNDRNARYSLFTTASNGGGAPTTTHPLDADVPLQVTGQDFTQIYVGVGHSF